MSNKQRVLIIDDDSRNIFALSAVLSSKGYQCLSSTSAEEGLRMVENEPDIAAVLMDIMMPDMDGYEAIRRIRDSDKINSVPVIAVTARAMVGDKEKCIEAGANDYVSKPVDIDALMNIFNRLKI